MDMPIVLVNSRHPSLSWVDIDNVSASKQIVEFLIKNGHKKILFIGGYENSINTRDRKAGYKSALLENNIPFRPNLVRFADYTCEGAYKVIKQRIKKNDFTAVFACNDLMAMGTIKAIQDCGLKVPGNISVAGFDDMDSARVFSPALTTYRQPFYDVGKTAVDLLFSEIKASLNGVRNVQNAILTGELVVRESVKSVRKLKVKGA